MEKIKFRAWDKVYKHFHEGDIVRDYNLGEFLENHDYEVSQYTGLKDKNGKEIYEGDLIYWKIDNGIGIESYTAIVLWSENIDKYKSMYKWIILYSTDYLRGSFDELSTPAAYNYELQIIGNIYENPELLNEN